MRWRPKHAAPHLWFGAGRSSWFVAALGVGLCLIAGAGLWAALGLSKHSDTAERTDLLLPPAVTATSAAPVGGRPSAATPSAATLPVSIDIPAIHVHTTLQQLGLGADGALNPPTNLAQAGWYTGGPVPGSNGPAVIAGHVDSISGPAVFYNLKSLVPGDAVTVGLNSGQSVAFRVTAVQRYPKNEFPTEAVYGPRPDPELRLITCGGGFAAGHYLDNVVVYAAEQPAA